jgi:alkylation response protein AidB-like acyl-CoA dehydrogenase
MIADMAMAVETARLMVYKACWMKDQGMDYSLESAMAKCLAADVAMKVTTDAVQVMGGYGYMKEYPVEKMMRDAKIMQIYEGTNQIQRLVIANNILY